MYSSSVNLLGMPKDVFGNGGISVGNRISQECAKHGTLKAEYHSDTRKITILNSSEMSPAALEILLQNAQVTRPSLAGWLAKVSNQRRQENLEVELLDDAGDDQSIMLDGLWSSFFEDELALSEKILFEKKNAIHGTASEIASMEKDIAKGVVSAMQQYFNKHTLLQGVWYPDDYRKILKDKFDIEMDESFHMGFANEQFWEKTGNFTFKLKEGCKPSQALLSFLEGPTVADCGNATTACYYKCILDIIGEEKFDQVFGSKGFALKITQRILDEDSLLLGLAGFTQAAKNGESGVPGKRPLKIGEECHFSGVIWYGNKHPKGPGGGMNVLYIGDNAQGEQLFMAHGFEKPLTEREIIIRLIESYNRERTPQDEKHIAELQEPLRYAKKVNPHLVIYYTITMDALSVDPNFFIKGFKADTCNALKAPVLVGLKKAQDGLKFMLHLALS